MNKTLALKYRPKTFEEVCGQELTVKILKRSIETNRIKNIRWSKTMVKRYP